MTRIVVAVLLATAATLPIAAQAEGSRMPAGGNLMSTYVDHPNHDPRSLWSQQNRTGQILGQPMTSERAGAPVVSRRDLVSPHWANGTSSYRRAR